MVTSELGKRYFVNDRSGISGFKFLKDGTRTAAYFYYGAVLVSVGTIAPLGWSVFKIDGDKSGDIIMFSEDPFKSLTLIEGPLVQVVQNGFLRRREGDKGTCLLRGRFRICTLANICACCLLGLLYGLLTLITRVRSVSRQTFMNGQKFVICPYLGK